MLSERERRALEEIERSLVDEVESRPARRPPRWRVWARRRPWAWAAALLLGSVSVFLIMEGAASGGVALALAGAFSWLLWRYWPQLREQGDPALLAEDDSSRNGPAPRRPAQRAPRRAAPRRSADS